MLKRMFDFLVSLIGIVILLPIWIITGFLIIIFMSYPIFFIQKRIGRNGKEFRLIKFRTMKVESKTIESTFNAGTKSRITALGKILRQTKIDELPQLLNVLKGDMSLVGPRPEVKKWTEVYPDKWSIVHSVKPGITDIAACEFRNEEELLWRSPDPEATYRNVILPRKLYLYIEYVNNHTFRGDSMIILRTIQTILFR